MRKYVAIAAVPILIVVISVAAVQHSVKSRAANVDNPPTTGVQATQSPQEPTQLNNGPDSSSSPGSTIQPTTPPPALNVNSNGSQPTDNVNQPTDAPPPPPPTIVSGKERDVANVDPNAYPQYYYYCDYTYSDGSVQSVLVSTGNFPQSEIVNMCTP